MPEIATLLLFAASVATLVLIPGPNLIYIVTRSVEAGRKAGLASVPACAAPSPRACW
jgi:threonine/homoserine/homoserine lactone efflux protein